MRDAIIIFIIVLANCFKLTTTEKREPLSNEQMVKALEEYAKRIQELEKENELLKSGIQHLDKEATKHATEKENWNLDRKEIQRSEQHCRSELGAFAQEVAGIYKTNLKLEKDLATCTKLTESLRQGRDAIKEDANNCIKELHQRKECKKVLDVETFLKELDEKGSDLGHYEEFVELRRLYGQCLIRLESPSVNAIDNEQINEDDDCKRKIKNCEKFAGSTRVNLDEYVNENNRIKKENNKLQQKCNNTGAQSAQTDFENRAVNCEETLKVVREKYSKDSESLAQMTKEHEALKPHYSNCMEELNECDASKSHLEYIRKGYDMIIKGLESDVKNAKDDKEKSLDDAKIAVQGAKTYRLYLATIGVLLTIVFTVKLYGFAKKKFQERTAAILASKQLAKQETKKRGTNRTKTDKQKTT